MKEEGRKEKVFSMPDGGAVGAVLITVGMDFLLWRQHTHTCMQSYKHTHMQSDMLSLHTTCPAPGHQRPKRALIFSGGRRN